MLVIVLTEAHSLNGNEMAVLDVDVLVRGVCIILDASAVSRIRGGRQMWCHEPDRHRITTSGFIL